MYRCSTAFRHNFGFLFTILQKIRGVYFHRKLSTLERSMRIMSSWMLSYRQIPPAPWFAWFLGGTSWADILILSLTRQDWSWPQFSNQWEISRRIAWLYYRKSAVYSSEHQTIIFVSEYTHDICPNSGVTKRIPGKEDSLCARCRLKYCGFWFLALP